MVLKIETTHGILFIDEVRDVTVALDAETRARTGFIHYERCGEHLMKYIGEDRCWLLNNNGKTIETLN